jgi:RNA polymerase sigma-70 factor (ECF subfamily)
MPLDRARPRARALDPGEEQAAIIRIRSGDAEGLGLFVREYTGSALRLAYRLLENRQDAEDVVQEGFMAVLKNIDSFELGRPFGPWFHRIVANRAHNLIKSRALRDGGQLSASMKDPRVLPDEAAQKAQAADRVASALAQLPDDQRTIVRLFEIDGFTSAEIAEVLQIAPGTVRWHLHQARRNLRRILDPSGHRAAKEVADGQP